MAPNPGICKPAESGNVGRSGRPRIPLRTRGGLRYRPSVVLEDAALAGSEYSEKALAALISRTTELRMLRAIAWFDTFGWKPSQDNAELRQWESGDGVLCGALFRFRTRL